MANGLVTKHTDLKSLKYNSMPFGGAAPYITKDVNNPPTSNTTGIQLQKRLDDTLRIAKMLKDKPGLKFLANEALLQQTHTVDKLSKASNVGKEALSIAKNTLIGTTKIALSTLAQVPVNGTGTHFIQGFRTDTYLQPKGGNTRSQFAQFFGARGVEGAQYALKGETIPGEHLTELSPKTSDLSPYSSTEDQVATDTTLGFNNVSSEDAPYQQTFPQTQLSASNSEYSPYSITEDKFITDTTLGFTNVSSDSNTYTAQSVARVISGSTKGVMKETRVNLGNQALPRASYDNYAKLDQSQIQREDLLNSADISNDRLDGKNEVRDLAKLYFQIITPDDEKFLYFRAFIDSFDDSYGGTWSGHKYVGRAENFFTYGGFERDITLSFKIAPATRAELKPLYKKMVYLASATAPTYGESGLMRGTLVKMTVGSYLNQTPGVLTSVKYSLVDNTPWEIAMGQPEGAEEDVQVLPMVIQCSITFKPIHDFAPQTGLYHYITSKDTKKPFFTEGAKL